MIQHAVYSHLAGLTNAVDVTNTSRLTGASLAQSSEQAPFTSKFVGSILATDSCEMSQSTSAESRGFSPGATVSSHRES